MTGFAGWFRREVPTDGSAPPSRGALWRATWPLTTVILCTGLALVLSHAQAFAQKPDGYVSVGVDALPNVAGSPVELRARIFADEKLTPLSFLTLRLAGSLDGVIRRKIVRDEFQFLPSSGTQKLKFVPNEFHVELASSRADLRIGYSRVVWGRLDEVQPTDVVNPLDLARFFFDGRSDARLPVAMARARVFFGERANIEALLVPHFRRGRFDQLDEPTSPFNLETGTVPVIDAEKGDSPRFLPRLSEETGTVPVFRREPATTLRNVQGGGRFSATTGRVDWSAAFFRGFEPYGVYLTPPLAQVVTQVFPRYTMVGGDFETTRGRWALRGEAARLSGEVDAFDGGIGFDRRAGDYHVSGTLLVHHENEAAPLFPSKTTTSVVGAADRTFAREKYRTRAFGVYNMTDGALFVRNITSMELRANVTLEGSIGWFIGTGSPQTRRDAIGRFSDRDFLYARLRVHF